jgi:CTP synthase
LGGTVGDIESLPYLEALRQLRYELGQENCLVIHLTLIPFLAAAQELKTKPTQHSVKELLRSGIQPDILVCRTEHPLTDDLRRKLALFCNVDFDSVVESRDAETIYDVPLLMLKEKLDKTVLSKLHLPDKKEPNLRAWKAFLGKLKNPLNDVNIALVGKYNELPDAYKSIHEAFIHAGAVNECLVNVIPVHSEELENSVEDTIEILKKVDGVLVAPGFGERGVEGKIRAIQYCRENSLPFFGICLGMQCAVIEFSRNVLNLSEADSSEFSPITPDPVIDLMPDQKKITQKGGTMRLGAYDCAIKEKSLAWKIYKQEIISERHRHRYEFNNKYLRKMQKAGLQASGVNPETGLVEIVELNDHPWFIGVQFHPELKSTVENPHPLFVHFIKSTLKLKLKKVNT